MKVVVAITTIPEVGRADSVREEVRSLVAAVVPCGDSVSAQITLSHSASPKSRVVIRHNYRGDANPFLGNTKRRLTTLISRKLPGPCRVSFVFDSTI